MGMSDRTYPCCACCDESPHREEYTHTSACSLCQPDPDPEAMALAACAWDEGADFVARNPGMSAEYVRNANPYRAKT